MTKFNHNRPWNTEFI